MILEYLKTHNGITTWEAHEYLRIERLAARISDLKKSGYIVADSWEYETLDGKVVKKWKRYKVVGHA